MSNGPDKTVYRSTDERNVSLWEQAKEAKATWDAAVEAFVAEFVPTGCQPMISDSFGTRVTGVTVEGHGSVLPDGWRLDRKRWMLVPFRKTAQGKKIAKAMDALTKPDPRIGLVGMPSWAFIDMSICHPGMELIDGALYVVWSGNGPGENAVDLTIWEPVKLSEWYAIQEAKESAKGEQ